MWRVVAEIQQEIAIKCGEVERITRWKSEFGQEPPDKSSLEYNLLVSEIDEDDPVAVADAEAYLEKRKTFDELVEERVLVEQPRQSTLRNWNTHIKQLKQWSKSEYPHRISKDQANAYRKHLLGRISHNSARASIACLKGMWSYGVNAGYLDTNVWDGLTRKLDKPVKHELPSDELLREADEKAIKGKDYRYLVMRYTGCRKSEVNGLRWCDINIKSGLIAFLEWESNGMVRRLKGGKSDERQVPITHSLMPHLIELMSGVDGSSKDPIWPKAYKPSDQSWGAGWAGSFRDKFGFTSHDLRRVVVTQLLLTNVSPFILYAITRHKVPGMSDVVELYTRPTVDELRQSLTDL